MTGITKITRLKILCLLGLALLILACGEEESQPVKQPVSTAEDAGEEIIEELSAEELAALKEEAEKEIRQNWLDFAQAVSDHKKKEISKYWIDSKNTFLFLFARWGNPGQNYQVKGTRNIVDIFGTWWTDKNWKNLRLVTDVSQVVIQDDDAVSTGNYDFSVTLGRGTYVALWRKSSGRWGIFGVDFPDQGMFKRLDFDKEKEKILK
ncbi:TPA: hypothetical protein EYP66_21565 [Candidatus Poribacteria bacterium]|nr:hypothetical protein [Candidatus Poribacteria bacterium]